MCRAELLAQQPVLSGAVVFGACVCGRVTTRLVQTCAVTIREPVGSTRRPWSGSIKTSADGHVHTSKTIYGRNSFFSQIRCSHPPKRNCCCNIRAKLQKNRLQGADGVDSFANTICSLRAGNSLKSCRALFSPPCSPLSACPHTGPVTSRA